MMAATIMVLAVSLGDTGLSLTDVPAYRDALLIASLGTPEPVSFRKLWDQPESYRGRFVCVEGRVIRRFQTGPVGELSARTELWLATPSGDLFCVVFRSVTGNESPNPIGEIVNFSGTALGKVSYSSGDVPRLAPLIVGAYPPVRTSPVSPHSEPSTNQVATDWLIAAVLGLAVIAMLARGLARKPIRTRREVDPPLEFIDSPSINSPRTS